jgi:hypothetical protein
MQRLGKLGLVCLELVRVREHHDGIILPFEHIKQLAQLVV